MGHVISGEGVSVDPRKVERIANWPTPSGPDHLSSFLGLASYYRRYIRDFDKIASPLHALTATAVEKAGNPSGFPKGGRRPAVVSSRSWEWSTEADVAF